MGGEDRDYVKSVKTTQFDVGDILIRTKSDPSRPSLAHFKVILLQIAEN